MCGLRRSNSRLNVPRQTRTQTATTNKVITVIVRQVVDTEIPICMVIATAVETIIIKITVMTIDTTTIDAMTINVTATTVDTGQTMTIVVVPLHKNTRLMMNFALEGA